MSPHSTTTSAPCRRDGFLDLRFYAAVGDGRSTALIGADGAIDWWCVPDMHSPPLFNRLVDAGGGFFAIAPKQPYEVLRRYERDSNVLETVFLTSSGKARMLESINSGTAGRLPWCELVRRVEGLAGTVEFDVTLQFAGPPTDTVFGGMDGGPPYRFVRNDVLGVVLTSGGVDLSLCKACSLAATFRVHENTREILAVIAGCDEPLVVPSVAEADGRLDVTRREWRDWCDRLNVFGSVRSELLRDALVLKLLLFSPTGAIVASPSSSLPEKIGGERNYDYRLAWVRDAAYVIKAFLSLGQQAEAKAAFTWLRDCIRRHGPKPVYGLDGGAASITNELTGTGYKGSRPIVRGNDAAEQWQHGTYGDFLEIAFDFTQAGNLLDASTTAIICELADGAAVRWREPDAGIWELPDARHYTSSKISCWLALDRAVRLAEAGHLNSDAVARWRDARAAIVEWINTYCWSTEKAAYLAWPASDEFDASVSLGVRFGFPARDRLASTIIAIDRELGAGPFHYRCTWSKSVEGCFLACTLWLILAKHELGLVDEAQQSFAAFKAGLGSYVGILPEMIDPANGDFLGNIPLGLTHLAMVQVHLELAGMGST